ncbi:hypothetical protein NC652_040716 [Populus alba x Populus x berolinensis]|nr:hypothetical protein NC652_040716 [Populus alba x Populus x berolinensis]
MVSAASLVSVLIRLIITTTAAAPAGSRSLPCSCPLKSKSTAAAAAAAAAAFGLGSSEPSNESIEASPCLSEGARAWCGWVREAKERASLVVDFGLAELVQRLGVEGGDMLVAKVDVAVVFAVVFAVVVLVGLVIIGLAYVGILQGDFEDAVGRPASCYLFSFLPSFSLCFLLARKGENWEILFPLQEQKGVKAPVYALCSNKINGPASNYSRC